MPSLAKELMMKEIKSQFEANPYAFVSSFSTLSVAKLSDLRQKLSKVAPRSMLLKHAMAKKVFQERNWSGAEKLLTGHVLVTFGQKEPQVISKTIMDFAKENDKFVATGVIFEDKIYDNVYVKQLASLPSRQELLTQLVVRVQSPLSGFVMTLNQVLKGFVVALNEVKKLKEMQAQPS